MQFSCNIGLILTWSSGDQYICCRGTFLQIGDQLTLIFCGDIESCRHHSKNKLTLVNRNFMTSDMVACGSPTHRNLLSWTAIPIIKNAFLMSLSRLSCATNFDQNWDLLSEGLQEASYTTLTSMLTSDNWKAMYPHWLGLFILNDMFDYSFLDLSLMTALYSLRSSEFLS